MIIIVLSLSYSCDKSQTSLLPTVSAAYSRAFGSSRFPSFAPEVIHRGGGGSKDQPPAKKKDPKDEEENDDDDSDDKEDDDNNDTEEEEEGDASQEEVVEILKEEEQQQLPAVLSSSEKKSKPKKISVLSSPFRMNEAVKEQASSSGMATTASSTSSSSSVLYGGAIVKTNPEKVPHKPLDTSRVAPFSSRLITETLEETTEETEEPSQKQMTDVAKLWWVNVWTQQLEEAVEDEDDDDDDQEELSAAEESELSQKEESDVDSEMEDTILKIAIDDETKTDVVQAEDTFEQELKVIEQDTASDSSTLPEEESFFESVVVPNYVSSGLVRSLTYYGHCFRVSPLEGVRARLNLTHPLSLNFSNVTVASY
jgi:hypothetical protein